MQLLHIGSWRVYRLAKRFRQEPTNVLLRFEEWVPETRARCAGIARSVVVWLFSCFVIVAHACSVLLAASLYLQLDCVSSPLYFGVCMLSSSLLADSCPHPTYTHPRTRTFNCASTSRHPRLEQMEQQKCVHMHQKYALFGVPW